MGLTGQLFKKRAISWRERQYDYLLGEGVDLGTEEGVGQGKKRVARLLPCKAALNGTGGKRKEGLSTDLSQKKMIR